MIPNSDFLERVITSHASFNASKDIHTREAPLPPPVSSQPAPVTSGKLNPARAAMMSMTFEDPEPPSHQENENHPRNESDGRRGSGSQDEEMMCDSNDSTEPKTVDRYSVDDETAELPVVNTPRPDYDPDSVVGRDLSPVAAPFSGQEEQVGNDDVEDGQVDDVDMMQEQDVATPESLDLGLDANKFRMQEVMSGDGMDDHVTGEQDKEQVVESVLEEAIVESFAQAEEEGEKPELVEDVERLEDNAGSLDDVKAFIDESNVLESQAPENELREQPDPFVESAEMVVAEEVDAPRLLLQRQPSVEEQDDQCQPPVEEQEECVSVPTNESMFEDEAAAIPLQNDLGSSDLADAVDIADAGFVEKSQVVLNMDSDDCQISDSVSSGNEEEELKAPVSMRVDAIEKQEAVVDENSVTVPGMCIN